MTEELKIKLMDWADRFAGDQYGPQRDAIRDAVNNPDNIYHQLILRIVRDVDTEVLKTTFVNFILNANLIGWPKEEEARKKYGCNIPWAILMDPTSACNLRCTGCWAAEYGNKLRSGLTSASASPPAARIFPPISADRTGGITHSTPNIPSGRST